MKILNNKILTVLFSALAIFALSGCGSNGIPSENELVGGTLPVSTVPGYYLSSDAGQDKSVADGDNVSLHGVASTDEPNASFKAVWVQTDGNFTVALTDVDTFNPTFVAPHVQVKMLLTFKLQVSSGARISEDTVTITVLPTTLSQVLPPNVITTHIGSTITVHSTALPLAGGQAPTHSWTQISGPSVTLTTPSGPSTGFVAPGTTGTVVLQHVATNSTTSTTTTTQHTTHVVAPTTQLSVIVSPPQVVYESLTGSLHLSVSGGTTPYGYTWTQTKGPALPLDTSDPLNPTFLAPTVNADTVIELKVVVTDGTGKSITKLIPITIKDVALAIKASGDVLTQGSHTTHLHVTPIATPNIPVLNPITYHWSETGGSSATINAADTANPGIVLPAGSAIYTFKVEATDNTGNTAEDTVSITALDGLHVNAGKDFVTYESSNFTLHALSTGAFGATKIVWTQTAGTTATLQNTDTLNPTVSLPRISAVKETATFKLEITDTKGRTSSDSVDVTVLPVLPKVSISSLASIPVSFVSAAQCSTAGGVKPFTFAWNVTPGTDATTTAIGSSSTESNVSIHAISSVNSPVTLTCEVTDAVGRKVTATQTISIYDVPTSIPLSVTASISQTITENQVGILSVHAQGGTGPYTYQWHSGNISGGTIQNETSQNASFTPPIIDNTQGLTGSVEEFFVTVTDHNGDSVESSHQYMTITDVPVTVSVSGSTTILQGQELKLTAAAHGGDGNYAYAWTQPGQTAPYSTSSVLTLRGDYTDLVTAPTLVFILTVKNTIRGITETATNNIVITVKPKTTTP